MTPESVPSISRPSWLGRNRTKLVWLCSVLLLGVLASTQKHRVARWLRGKAPTPVPAANFPVFAVPPASDADRAEVSALLAGPGRVSWSLLDGVSLYQRAGFVEHYGTDFRERRSRPVEIDRSVFPVAADEAFLMWWPERTPAVGDASLLEVAFADPVPAAGSITVGLLMLSGEAYTFGHEFAPHPRTVQELPFFPEDFRDAVRSPVPTALVAGSGGRLHAVLPPALREQLKGPGGRSVRCWFLHLGGLANSEVAVRNVSLLEPAAGPVPSTATLAGTVVGLEGVRCKLSAIPESGAVITREVVAGRDFSVTGIPAGKPVSLRVEYKGQEYYADRGRWFVPGGDRRDLAIHLEPSYRNAGGHKPDPKERVARHVPKEGYSEWYAVHSRQVWNGSDDLAQQYEGKSFSNNISHLDRDRFFDNPDGCFRVVHLGSSHAVASQVRPCDKYNLLMEPDLGVRLGRPVEVISLGRNNGDLAANYPRLRDLAVKFHPDVVLIEHGSFLGLQVHPELLRRMHGYDPEHTHLDNFYYNPQGELVHRPSVADWPLYVSDKDQSELTPGIPFYDTLRVPFPHMHPVGREAYRYVADIMRFYRRQFPGPRIMLHTGLDQAQARGQYGRTVKLSDGTIIPVGADVFVKNMEEFAAREGIEVLQPRPPVGFGDKEDSPLTFVGDGHFSPRGHQWLARELTDALMSKLGPVGTGGPR